MRVAAQTTSIDAYHAHQASGMASQQRARILGFITDCGGDWSIGEVAYMLEMEKSTVSARLNEMLAKGDVVEKPRRKDRVSGVKIRPVGLPPGQLELLPC